MTEKNFERRLFGCHLCDREQYLNAKPDCTVPPDSEPTPYSVPSLSLVNLGYSVRFCFHIDKNI